MRNLSTFILVAVLAFATAMSGCAKKPKKVVVGFAQTGAESGWRMAHTKSVRGEAAKRGIDLRFVDGRGDQANQVKGLYSFIDQKVDCIVLSPIKQEGWDQVLKAVKKAKIPVLCLDRTVAVEDESLYTAFIGSDFIKEGVMAGEWLAKHTNGKANIVELEGTPGSAPAIERAKGFRETIGKYPDMKIIGSQSGDFLRALGKEVMEAMLKKYGDEITVLYAHNDDMAIGAIQAIEETGKKPGKDIIIVSVDALGDALKLIVEGKINCTVQCNPLLGPQAFDAVDKILAGQTLPKAIYMKDEVFDSTNAAEALKDWKY
jgi:simple sugar transport system substrate-binding protein